MKHSAIVAVTMVLVICLALSMTGCMGKVIAEDGAQSDLPQIDPEDGASRELGVTLYYRLANEEYLVGVEKRISVRSGERTEAAVIRGLLENTYVSSGVTGLIPSAVSVKELEYEDGVLYVTLSEDFLNEDIITAVRAEDYLKEKDYNSAVKAATREMYLVRRLGVLSIVNTITGSGENVKVQILIERNGKGEQLPLEELGFEGEPGEFIQPMEFDEAAVANEERTAACLLGHMASGEYEKAYVLVAENDDEYRPAYADFETIMRSLGTISSCEVTGMGSDDNGTYVLANVRLTSASGTVKRVSNAVLYMVKEGNIYKMSYGSLKKLMES